MNNKTAKLLRRVSVNLGLTKREAKNLWNDTPRDKREKLRKNLMKELSGE